MCAITPPRGNQDYLTIPPSCIRTDRLKLLFLLNTFILCGEFGSSYLTWVRLQQPQEQRYPFRTECAQTMAGWFTSLTPSCLRRATGWDRDVRRLAKRETVSISIATLAVTTRMTPALIKTGSDESHFNVSLIVGDKVRRQCPQTTTLEERGDRAKGESNQRPSAYQSNSFPLG